MNDHYYSRIKLPPPSSLPLLDRIAMQSPGLAPVAAAAAAAAAGICADP